MNTPIITSNVTDLRHKTNKVLAEAAEKGFVYLVRRSRVEAAVVDINYLNALQEAYEDYLDTIEFDRAIKEKKRIPLSTYLKSVKAK